MAVLAMVGALTWSSGAPILAQDQNNPDILKRDLAEAMSQLKAAQDRKNELANEYEKLKAQTATIQKQLEDAQRTLATHAEQTYALRAERAAWNAFIDRDPRLRARWEIYLETPVADFLRSNDNWFLEKPVPPSLFTSTTQPATQFGAQSATESTTEPASQPATTQATTNATTNPQQ
ncbi:MAG: hypothetical protein H7Z14_10815 [Anaerolineae bacterium]|nr:hypothetical protein [Phycisphaerae bacterium]